MTYPSIERLRVLLKTRADHSFWAENIIESEALCKSELEHKQFYAFLTNPHTYVDGQDVRETLGDLESRNELPGYEPADNRQEAKVFQNGTDVRIFVTNKSLVDDEKVEEKHE
jgi:hypothetical protein